MISKLAYFINPILIINFQLFINLHSNQKLLFYFLLLKLFISLNLILIFLNFFLNLSLFKLYLFLRKIFQVTHKFRFQFLLFLNIIIKIEFNFMRNYSLFLIQISHKFILINF